MNKINVVENHIHSLKWNKHELYRERCMHTIENGIMCFRDHIYLICANIFVLCTAQFYLLSIFYLYATVDTI